MTMRPWFPDAKLGVFLHWGIYAVQGVTESWSFFTGEITYAEYMRQLDGFTAARFDPDEWGRVFTAAGARYAVLTAKHHDGVALWDSAAGDLNVARRTPAGRDLVGEYVRAMRRHGVKVGLYFSHLDWSHPDYIAARPHDQDPEGGGPPGGHEESALDRGEHWERFLAFHRAQLRELADRYGPDLFWFDGQWELDERQWRMAELRDLLTAWAPQAVLNGRMLGHGDYATPEQGVPIARPEGPWELCLTMNDSWGHRHADHNHKSLRQIIRVFTETIGADGNLLLAIGPREDGTLVPEQVERMEGLGDWIRRHEEAVYGTGAGLPHGHHYGPSTLSADRRTLYLTLFDVPREFVAVRGIRNAVRVARVLGSGRELAHRTVGGFQEVPGVLYLDAPGEADLDPYATVIAVELDGELDLYTGAGHG
ncbi:alpha-L-fucosidase [Actinomadura hibisca]|uniref:alpha-L-fucosidase n=1 Tax=Actinomadura hibisca TaxID=68565 RepID=UPI00082B00C2|nr:alpha-L-fucosidase [Actinomadura hibisca]